MVSVGRTLSGDPFCRQRQTRLRRLLRERCKLDSPGRGNGVLTGWHAVGRGKRCASPPWGPQPSSEIARTLFAPTHRTRPRGRWHVPCYALRAPCRGAHSPRHVSRLGVCTCPASGVTAIMMMASPARLLPSPGRGAASAVPARRLPGVVEPSRGTRTVPIGFVGRVRPPRVAAPFTLTKLSVVPWLLLLLSLWYTPDGGSDRRTPQIKSTEPGT